MEERAENPTLPEEEMKAIGTFVTALGLFLLTFGMFEGFGLLDLDCEQATDQLLCLSNQTRQFWPYNVFGLLAIIAGICIITDALERQDAIQEDDEIE